MAAAKSSKVKQEEYEDPKAEAPKASAKESKQEWKVGQPAPSTQYLDRSTGEVTDKTPSRAQVIVFEGDTVTEQILRKLGK